MSKSQKQSQFDKANPLGLPTIAGAKVTDGKGRQLERTKDKAERKSAQDPRAANFDARCRALGVKASAHNRAFVNLPYLGHPVGQVLRKIGTSHPEILRIWHYWQAYCAAQLAYRTRILSLDIHPKCAGLQMISEAVTASPEDEPDTRTAEERDADAQAGYDRWQGILDRGMDPALRVALIAAERGDGPPLMRDGNPTQAGYAAARALHHLAGLAER